MRFAEGQRWISEPEPELGLGIVLGVETGRVKMFFPACNAMRLYASASAPLKRVRFKVGDTVTSHDGESFLVHIINERSDGVLTYAGSKGERLAETQLSDVLTYDKPGERIAAGQVDPNSLFELRLQALERQSQILRSPVHGFTGARIDLIPHQLGIAQEVSNRLLPRVLLADEVGLGKTIEACLILHRLHLTGRAERILILVPNALVNQWFVELLRRFNLLFSIFDEERCVAIEANNAGTNPFLDDQLILCSVNWLANSQARSLQAAEAGWNLLVVDEAHHLTWSPKAASPEYLLVETLGKQTHGLLLLTATPQQLGPEGHFARLRLLDPDRYPTLDAFQAEAEAYAPVAQIADKLVSQKKLTAKEYAFLSEMPGSIARHAEVIQNGDDKARKSLLAELLAQRGPGSLIFRNTRTALTGFPKRIAKLIPLEGDAALAHEEFTGAEVSLTKDPRIKWLVTFIKKLKSGKALLICRTQQKAEAVEAALREHVNLPMALFHEGLTLLQRDRNAAYFSEEDGAQILICSEIGSEGRNFQFAHHLVLFDLPENPELLEQRIGRLDRIGQTSNIHIHVPYIAAGAYEVLARWLHEGLNAFEESTHGAAELYAQFGQQLRALAYATLPVSSPKKTSSTRGRKKSAASEDLALIAETPEIAYGARLSAGLTLDSLIKDTQSVAKKVREKLAAGQDRLLELSSARHDAAESIISSILAADSDTSLDDFMLEVFDLFGAHVEDIGPRTWIVIPGPGGESIPGIPAEGTTLTSERKRALSREEVAFLTWDHPAVRGALELVLGGRKGNAALAIQPNAEAEGLLLEAVYMVEVIAPAELHAARFLPPTPVRVIIDARGIEWNSALGKLSDAPVTHVLGKMDLCYKLLPRLLEQAQKLGEARGYQLIAASILAMQTIMKGRVQWLRDMHSVNPNVKESDISTAENHLYDLRDHLAEARIRLDSVRLIFRETA